MKLGKPGYLVVIAVLGAAAAASAAPGDFDATFRGTNQLFNMVTPVYFDDQAFASVIQPDGKIVVAGAAAASSGDNTGFALARYNADGTFDQSFGTAGKVLTVVGSSDSYARAVALQSDGKIVAAGLAYDSPYFKFAVVRYKTDGSLDTGFGSGGVVLTAVGSGSLAFASAVAARDLKIVVAGSADTGSGFGFAVVRYNSNGTLDTTFNGTGQVITAVGTSSGAAAVLIQPDGRVVAAGSTTTAGNEDFALVRYSGNGTLDGSFNGTGKVVTPIGTSNDQALALVRQPDDKLIAAGRARNGSSYDVALARYNSNGTLDTSFNATGTATASIGSFDDDARAVVVRSDGRIVCAGRSSDGSDDSFALVSFNSDGSLNTSFNGTGKVTTPTGLDSPATGLVLESDDSVVATGYDSAGSGFVLVRYDATGAIDYRYAPGVTGTENGAIQDIALQADGKIVAVGPLSETNNFFVTRFESDGAGDSSFGSDGDVITPIGPSDEYSASTVAIQSDGRILVGGYAYTGGTIDFSLTRYTDTGTLDASFGSSGRVATAFSSNLSGVAALLVQHDQKIVAAGWVTNGGTSTFGLSRYNTSDGSLDTSFGTGGKLTTAVGTQSAATAIAEQSDHKLVAAGWGFDGTHYNFAVVRFDQDGSLDTSFGTNGIATVVASYLNNVALVIEPAGKIVVAATVGAGALVLARFNADGTLDTSFGHNGLAGGSQPLSALANGGGHALLRQRDGSFLISGYYVGGGTQYVVYHCNNQGQFETILPFLTYFNADGTANAALQQPDGRLLLAGSQGNGGQIVRLLTSYCDLGQFNASCNLAAKSSFVLKQGDQDSGDKLAFKWTKGTASVAKSNIASPPVSMPSYSLCVYDNNGLELQATIPWDQSCLGGPCWTDKSNGFKYKDPSVSTGIIKGQIFGGDAGKPKLQMTGRGSNLPDLPSPTSTLQGDVSVMVVNEESGLCFSATYSGAAIVHNDATLFKAKH